MPHSESYELLKLIDTYAAAHSVGDNVTRKMDWLLMEAILKANQFNDEAADLGVPAKIMIIVIPTAPEAWAEVKENA